MRWWPGPASRVTLEFPCEATHLELKGGQVLRWIGSQRGKEFDLRPGALQVRAASQPWSRPLRVHTPHANVRVLGTEFSLVASTNSTKLAVQHGRVEPTQSGDGRRIVVGSGQQARVPCGTEMAALPVTGGILCETWTNVPGAYHVNRPCPVPRSSSSGSAGDLSLLVSTLPHHQVCLPLAMSGLPTGYGHPAQAGWIAEWPAVRWEQSADGG